MYKHSFMETDANGHLIVGGCEMVSVAEEYQTPVYVMDEGRIRSNMRAYKNSIYEFFNFYLPEHCYYISNIICCQLFLSFLE